MEFCRKLDAKKSPPLCIEILTSEFYVSNFNHLGWFAAVPDLSDSSVSHWWWFATENRNNPWRGTCHRSSLHLSAARRRNLLETNRKVYRCRDLLCHIFWNLILVALHAVPACAKHCTRSIQAYIWIYLALRWLGWVYFGMCACVCVCAQNKWCPPSQTVEFFWWQ